MNPTVEQQRVIDAPIGNLLVSAAAGSGKTTVLVARIMNMISRRENPVDIDEILIVTFTRNAAAEMRTRIEKAIEKALVDDPNNERMQRQARNIHFAKISTIDSFCQAVVRRYCHLLDVNPGFRMTENSEAESLLAASIDEVLEEAFSGKDADFMELVARYGGKYGDSRLVEILRDVIKKCDSNAYPEEWLERNLKMFTEDPDPFDCIYTDFLFRDYHGRICDAEELLTAFLPRFTEPGMPPHLERAMTNDLEIISTLTAAADARELAARIAAMPAWPRATPKKQDKEVTDEGQKKLCESIRGKYKKTISTIADTIAMLGGGMERMHKECGASMTALCSLAVKARARYEEKQKELGAYDFSTIEHMALRILVGENHEPTQAALQLRNDFAEIMIDEYQDSNMLQEEILRVVSRDFDGLPNMFMVGDVKQSIYRFRKARPELFIGKCDVFTQDTDEARRGASQGIITPDGYRIDLQKNFRSREQVIDSVNEVFRRLMRRDVGGVEYDKRAELIYGNSYDSILWNAKDYESELRIATGGDSAVAAEADMIVRRIAELTDPVTGLRVRDSEHKEDTKGRIARYCDIVILMRSRSELYKELMRRLQESGIPACSASADGFFESAEVTAVISLLRVIDNPFQEIPLAEVLTLPVFGFSADDLARIMILARERGTRRKPEYMQNVIREIASASESGAKLPEGVSEKLAAKCVTWIAQYDRLREHAMYISASEVMEEFMGSTGFAEYCSGLPDSEVRRRNLRMLCAKAAQLRETSAGRVTDFLAYIDNSIQYDNGSFEDTSSQGNADAVRLMTIHASKGLEFPIVILADTKRQANLSDLKGNLLIHDDFGFGPEIFYPRVRMKSESLAKRVISRKLLSETVGEELRLLYVAMTRAQEKLIVTGYLPSVNEIGSCLGDQFRYSRRLSYTDMLDSNASYLPLLLRAIAGMCTEEETERFYMGSSLPEDYCAKIGSWTLRMCPDEPAAWDAEDVTDGEKTPGQTDATAQNHTEARNDGAAQGNATYPNGGLTPEETELYRNYTEELDRYHAFRYRYSHDEDSPDIPVKVSVSYVKKQKYLAKEAEEEEQEKTVTTDRIAPEWTIQPDEQSLPIPAFVREPEEQPSRLSPTMFGTACHRYLQLHDYSRENTAENVLEEIRGMVDRRQLSEAEAMHLKPEPFLRFFESELGLKMRAAFLQGTLERERSFVMKLPARLVYPSDDARSAEEPVLVQGTIDAWFEYKGEIHIVDYKTDRVEGDNAEKTLIDRYRLQLELYADALSGGLGREVKHLSIYSFALNKSIDIMYNNSRRIAVEGE